MLMLAMAMLVADYPVYDEAVAIKVCTAKHSEPSYSSIFPTDFDCLLDQQANCRRFVLVAANADEIMRTPFARCVAIWSGDSRVDWNMATFCVIGNLDGKRDFELLRRDAAASVRPSFDSCLLQASDPAQHGVVVMDWDAAADCARAQISGARDFALFAAAAKDDAARATIKACRAAATDDHNIVDWDEAASCAAMGHPTPPREEDPGAIVVT